MIENRINISQTFGGRLDPQFYNPRFTSLVNKIECVGSLPLHKLAKLSSETWNQKDYFDDIFPYIEISAINIESGDIDDISWVEKNNAPSRAKKIVRNDDIIISTTRPNRGAISLVSSDDFYIASTGFTVLREVDQSVLRDYLFIVLRQSFCLEQMEQRCSGGNYPAITEDELKKIIIPLPPMEVQRNIVDIYTKASDEKRAKEQQALALLDSIDSYLLGELGITLPETPQRQLAFKVNISEMLGNRYDPYYHQEYFVGAFDRLNHSLYKKVKLGDISLKITSGTTPLSGGDAYTKADDGIAFVRSGNIDINGNLNFDDLLYLKPEVHEKKMKSSQVSHGDLMIAIVGATIGQVGIYIDDREANINQAIALVRLEANTNKQFFKEQVKSSIGQLNLNRLKRPVARANINLEEISTMQLICPPIEKQNEIASHINEIRAKAEALQTEAAAQLTAAKSQIEKIILG